MVDLKGSPFLNLLSERTPSPLKKRRSGLGYLSSFINFFHLNDLGFFKSFVTPEFCTKIVFSTSWNIFHARKFVHRWLTILMPINWTIQYFRVVAQQIEVMNQTIQSLSSPQM